MKKIFRSNFYGMMIIILGIVFSFTIGIVMVRNNFSVYLSTIIGQIVLFLVPAVIYFGMTKLKVKETLRFNKINVKDVFFIILIAITVQPLVMGLSGLSAFIMPNTFGQVISNPVVNSSLWITVLVIGIVPALLEEITFRGIVLSGYNDVSIRKGAVSTAVYFAIMHYDLQRFLYTFVLGFIFVYLVRITNSIFSSMLCHGLVNSIQMIYLKAILSVSKNGKAAAGASQSLRNMPVGQRIGIIVTFVVFIIVGAVLTYLLVKKLKKNHIGEMMKIDTAEEVLACKEEKEEKIINWPFIVTIIIYIALICYTFKVLKN
ncbi:CPBP family intramembrane glutamic endopeptidase [Clostridium lundense]|uniref:CPBP family intramembrane glutamic endopeptidase n=1 Tax=Clostridium lundense TaxID=319475 RepID=UPI000485DCBE|nr:type II CAAX endopeptidase family protein [Clostridium lundense]